MGEGSLGEAGLATRPSCPPSSGHEERTTDPAPGEPGGPIVHPAEATGAEEPQVPRARVPRDPPHGKTGGHGRQHCSSLVLGDALRAKIQMLRRLPRVGG